MCTPLLRLRHSGNDCLLANRDTLDRGRIALSHHKFGDGVLHIKPIADLNPDGITMALFMIVYV